MLKWDLYAFAIRARVLVRLIAFYTVSIFAQIFDDDTNGSSGNIECEIEKRDDNYSAITALPGYAAKVIFVRVQMCLVGDANMSTTNKTRIVRSNNTRAE